MVMLNKDYMIGHMKDEKNQMILENVIYAASSEAVEFAECCLQMNQSFAEWNRFVRKLEELLSDESYEMIQELCQTMYQMRHYVNELEGLKLAGEDAEVQKMYYQVFVTMLDLTLFSTESMLNIFGGTKHE